MAKVDKQARRNARKKKNATPVDTSKLIITEVKTLNPIQHNGKDIPFINITVKDRKFADVAERTILIAQDKPVPYKVTSDINTMQRKLNKKYDATVFVAGCVGQYMLDKTIVSLLEQIPDHDIQKILVHMAPYSTDDDINILTIIVVSNTDIKEAYGMKFEATA